MSDPLPFLPSRDEIESRYRVQVLCEARVADPGVRHLQGGAEALLPWGSVARVFAAEVGEQEGILIVVFDLVLEGEDGGVEVRRLAAEPGDEAVAVARSLEGGVPGDRLAPAVKSIASEGRPMEWYPDLESFEEATLYALAGS